MISVVVGLLLVFRNGASFARWEDGRKTFGAMQSAIRNLCRYTWVHVGAVNFEESSETPYKHPKWTKQDQEAKEQAMLLAVAIMVACKHHVRQEFGTGYDDLRDLLPARLTHKFGGKAAYGSFPDCASPHEDTPYSNGSPTETDHVVVHHEWRRPAIPLPLMILHYLQVYYARQHAKGFMVLAAASGYNQIHQLLSALTTELNAVERLSNLPIPLVYGIHLKQVVTLYLFLLPLTLVETMGYSMVPFVTAMAFILVCPSRDLLTSRLIQTCASWASKELQVSFETALCLLMRAQASECEQPFGRDLSDLPLDLFCTELQQEIEHLILHFPDTLDDGI
jgi:putative membrane protein